MLMARRGGGAAPASGRSCRGPSASCGRRRTAVSLEFLLEDVGPGTNRLCELGHGDGLSLVGPLGVGFAPREMGGAPLLVGGGVGIAPLVILQDDLGD